MPRTKGSKNKAKTDSQPEKSETSSVESPVKARPSRATSAPSTEPVRAPENQGLSAKQKSKILARNWTIAMLQRQQAELQIRLDNELDALAQDIAEEAPAAKPKGKTTRAPKLKKLELPTVFAPEQSEEAGAELDV